MQIKSYKVIKTIGEGAMGEVYLAKHPTLNKKVVIKQLKNAKTKKDIERFENEAANIYDFQSENIVNCYDHFRRAEEQYIVLEFVEGCSLAELLSKGDLDPTHALMLFREVCKGLLYSHQRNVIHRDIKPGNILISNEGEVKLADFGISIKPETLKKERKTSLIGTPSYMAPELFSNAHHAGFSTDTYAMGVVLYALLTGTRPFQNSLSDEAVFKIIKGKYKRIWRLPGWLSSLQRRMMHRTASKRPSMAEVVALLDRKILLERPEDVKEKISIYLDESLANAGQLIESESTVMDKIDAPTIFKSTTVIQGKGKKPVKSEKNKKERKPLFGSEWTKKKGFDPKLVKLTPWKNIFLYGTPALVVTLLIGFMFLSHYALVKFDFRFLKESKMLHPPVKLYAFNNGVDKEAVRELFLRKKGRLDNGVVRLYKLKVKSIFEDEGFSERSLQEQKPEPPYLNFGTKFLAKKGRHTYVLTFNEEYYYLLSVDVKAFFDVKYVWRKIPLSKRKVKFGVDQFNWVGQNQFTPKYMNRPHLNRFVLVNEAGKKLSSQKMRTIVNDYDLTKPVDFYAAKLRRDKTYFLDFIPMEKKYDRLWMVPVRGSYLDRAFTFEIHLPSKP